MTVSSFASGTLSATAGGTEDFLSSPNESGVFVLYVDLNNMVDGDAITLKAYKMVLTGGTARVLYSRRYKDAQEDKIIGSLSVSNDLAESNAVRFSLTQQEGSSRNFPWKVLKHN